MEKRVLATMLLILFSFGVVFAQTTGRLAGRVRDDNGNPIAYASVVLLGTDPLLGVQTREDGTYILINIPVGTYDVQSQQIGFRPTTVTGQRINVNETATLNIAMVRDAVEIEGLTFTAQREMVVADRTGSTRGITQESIENIAVESIEGIIALQAGATQIGDNLHVRGGRADEVVYTIDGMSVSDPVDGGTAMSIDMNAVADMVVMTGGFTAEYGNAQSGIVNIVTRDGTSEYSGSVELISDHIITDGSNNDEIKLTFGGPILGPAFPSLRNRLTFFFNAAGQWHDSRFREYYISDPDRDLKNLVVDFPKNDPYEDRNKFLIFDMGDRNFNSYNANLKFTYRHNPRQTFSFATRADYSRNIPYSHAWRYALDHFAEVEENMRQYMFTYDHMFNPQMNLNLKGSYFTKSVVQGPRDISRDDFYMIDPNYEFSPETYQNHREGIIFLDSSQSGRIDRYDYNFIDSRYWAYQIPGVERERGVPGFVAPGAYYQNFIDDETTTITFRGDFEYQLNMANNIKTGLEITRHEIIKDRLFSPQRENMNRFQAYLSEFGEVAGIIEVEDPSDPSVIIDTLVVYTQQSRYEAFKNTSGETDGYKATPLQGAFYIQDRLQFEGMIANVGLRFDFWYLGEDYFVRLEDGTRQRIKWDDWSDVLEDDLKRLRVMISPRVGVSHPISEKAVLHFAYNYQNQIPQMQYIFTTSKPEDAATSDNVIDVGNPNLEPQITVTYEVGLQRQLGEDYVMDITAYYKNIYNYVSLRRREHEEDDTIVWYQFVSDDYGSARGVDLTLQKMLSNFTAGSLSYSFAWAQGNHSGLTRQDEYTANLREFPLNWDARHSANLNFEFRIGRDEEWWIPFTDIVFPLDDLSLNFIYSISSGYPYTPMNEEGTQFLDTNSRRRPYTENANLRFTKNFRFGRKNNFRYFVRISNLFNKKNINSVYPITGRHDDDGRDLSEPNSDYTHEEVAYNYSQFILNPAMVSDGRNISMGLSFTW